MPKDMGSPQAAVEPESAAQLLAQSFAQCGDCAGLVGRPFAPAVVDPLKSRVEPLGRLAA